MYDLTMTMRNAFIGLVLVSAICVGCSDGTTPAGPSPVATSPQLAGNYWLTLTACQLPVGNDVASAPIGPYQSIWTFTQQDDVISGRYNSSSPPSGSTGSLTAQVGLSGNVTVTSLQFSWSSSHVGLLQFAASGNAVADKTQVAGTVSGDESFTEVFGGIPGSRYTCSGTQMPFKFTRLGPSESVR
jgi:hypothetical protein